MRTYWKEIRATRLALVMEQGEDGVHRWQGREVFEVRAVASPSYAPFMEYGVRYEHEAGPARERATGTALTVRESGG